MPRPSLSFRRALPVTVPALLSCFVATPASAADKGDEQGMVAAGPTRRDDDAAARAKAGWWTESLKTKDARLAWWREARFGMFIHWGVYSVAGGDWEGKPAGGYAEHLMRVRRITKKDYVEKLAAKFDPEAFDADAWVSRAKAAGMGYLVITAKHHDGFAMYDSAVSDFSLPKKTPFKRDPLAELAAACKRQGLKFGFYYSHAFDWEHPDAPGNDWEFKNPGGDRNLFGGREWYNVHPEIVPRVANNYVDKKSIPQILELIAKYRPDILWFDTPHKLPFSENLRILEAIRKAAPDIVVNGRLAGNRSGAYGDYANTADRPAELDDPHRDWEAIPTTNESYGYSRADRSHKSPAFFIRLLAEAVAKGGNLLLNIGPTGDGEFDPADTAILAGVAEWMKANGESIRGAGRSPLPKQNWGVITRKGDVAYLHVFTAPAGGKLRIGGLDVGDVTGAYELSDDKKSPLNPGASGADTLLSLPPGSPATPDRVIAVALKPLPVPPPEAGYTFVAPEVPVTRLLAFDATTSGPAFGRADGKRENYMLTGWTKKDQSLTWNFRTATAGKFAVVVKFSGGGEKSVSRVTVDDASVPLLCGGPAKREVVALTTTLVPGMHVLTLKPETIDGELMKPFEVRLEAKP